MSSNNDNSWIGYAVIAFIGFIAYLVWQFSTFFGLDMSTGGTVFGYLVGVALLTVGSLMIEFGPFRFGNVWPILLGLAWMCFWPALNFWASKDVPAYLLEDGAAAIWWSAWYTKLGGLIGIISLGYTGQKWIRGY